MDLLGHSHGAILALEAPCAEAAPVRGLVLYEGGFRVPEGTELNGPEAIDGVRPRLEADDL